MWRRQEEALATYIPKAGKQRQTDGNWRQGKQNKLGNVGGEELYLQNPISWGK